MLVTLVCVIVVPSVNYTIECHLIMVMDHFSHFPGNYERNYFLIIKCQDGKYNKFEVYCGRGANKRELISWM